MKGVYILPTVELYFEYVNCFYLLYFDKCELSENPFLSSTNKNEIISRDLGHIKT